MRNADDRASEAARATLVALRAQLPAEWHRWHEVIVANGRDRDMAENLSELDAARNEFWRAAV